ncbi:hypothetical protein HPB48_007529 [Haemaphysalis longicornis]|uniref:Uncharacterized protein n=1 Tax=Haemaphysalis longicornis TaxID=44386 RepID=A0A9J6GUR4_HAELO|nr:hypothetical protein HPB48_007529 [Haemaphysalis longicornis]
MVCSLTCKFKVADIVPVHTLDMEVLHKTLKDVIFGLEQIGYRFVNDNHVHILKWIRNHWTNQKNDQASFYFPDIETDRARPKRMQTASVPTVIELHSNE